MHRISKQLVALTLVLAAVGAACAVVPHYETTTSSFQGFPVRSSIPEHPRGIVYVFHGTGGSADGVTRLEMVDMLDHLTAAGYGFVATESTNRTAKQWDNGSLSLTANPDLARLAALHADLIARGRITATTPIEAIGMSQGAGFASVFAEAMRDAGSPVVAIAPSHGQIPIAVRAAGGLHVPVFTALGANDPIVDNAQVLAQIAAVRASGTPAEAVVEPETALSSGRFLRVPGVDADGANAIFGALVDAGLWSRAGHRLVSIDTVETTLPGLPVPPGTTNTQRLAIRDEIEVVMAVHQYSATYADRTVAFFDAHR